MANLVIPTEREDVSLREVTEAEDSAWLLTTRRRHLASPLPPHQKGAPDHDTYRKLRAERRREDPNTLNMGIWDAYNYEYRGVSFIGYVALYPQPDEKTAKVGYRIAERYRGLGYATIATRALINYARSERGIETVVAEMRPSNLASQQVARHLGFELTETRRNLLVFTQHAAESKVNE